MKQSFRLITIALITLNWVFFTEVASAQKAKPVAALAKIIMGSKNLNGPGKSDQVLDSADINPLGNLTLMAVLEKKIRGFNEGLFPGRTSLVVGLNPPQPPVSKISYRILDKEAHFVVDGLDLDDLYSSSGASMTSRDRLEFLKTYLSAIFAEEVKGVEVMSSSIFYNKYYNRYLSQRETDAMISTASFPGYAFIEITTYSGKGPQ